MKFLRWFRRRRTTRMAEPIGRIVAVWQDERGLHVEGFLYGRGADGSGSGIAAP